ncbi:cytochrome P450 family protein [Glonium stellatum]|uniref:Cytochrome P450 family protein n=1 Tax=Glonium stellatum TaxID=574774 RepID=A0A8E2JZG8_9PEZI|nr:cytochrome P450 family protein [Glonium stellatum]
MDQLQKPGSGKELIAFASIVPARVIFSVYRFYSSPLRNILGSLLARVINLWYFCKVYEGHLEKENIELHQKYGKIVRIAPNEFSIDDPDAIKVIYGHGTGFPKAGWYYGWTDPMQKNETLFTTRSIFHHTIQRRKYATSHSMSTLVGYEGFVDECGRILSRRFEELSGANLVINSGEWMQYYAFDIIGAITFSKRFGFLNNGEDIGGLIQANDNRRMCATLAGIYPSLHPLLFRVVSYLPSSGAAGFQYLFKFANERIGERKLWLGTEADDGPMDQVGRFLTAHMKRPDYFTTQDVLMGSLANILAGSDTTAISLSAILHYLCTHPEKMQKLRDKIDSIAKRGQVSDPVTLKETQTMTYLQAVIKESLRLHPATGLRLARKVPKGGATISGEFFPEGATVGINTWVAHYNRDIFGPDAHLFRPKRWIGADEKALSVMEQYNFPFGLGSCGCISKNISLLEIGKVIPQLVRRFDFELEEPGRELHCVNHWFVKQTDLRCRLPMRRQSTKVQGYRGTGAIPRHHATMP